MKLKTPTRVLLGAIMYATVVAANALTIGPGAGTEVGGLDIFVHVSVKNELPNSNPGTEEAWIESVLGVPVDYLAHGNNVPITATNEDPTAFAWELIDSASYFLVKNAAFWAIYENLDNKMYAVVDADSGLLPEKMNFGNATISHYGVASTDDDPNPPAEIPVPAPLTLIAIGLAGLGWSRKRQR